MMTSDGRCHGSPGLWNQRMEDGARDTVHGGRQTIIRKKSSIAARSGGSRSMHRTPYTVIPYTVTRLSSVSRRRG